MVPAELLAKILVLGGSEGLFFHEKTSVPHVQ